MMLIVILILSAICLYYYGKLFIWQFFALFGFNTFNHGFSDWRLGHVIAGWTTLFLTWFLAGWAAMLGATHPLGFFLAYLVCFTIACWIVSGICKILGI